MKLRQSLLVYCVAALMVAACVSSVEAQGRRGGQGGPGGRGGFQGPGMRGGNRGFGFGATSEMQLLGREDVRKELELLDNQIEELEDIDMRGMASGMFEDMRDAAPEERGELMRKAMDDIRKKVKAKIDAILLPHQATRLNQLAVQYSMRSPDALRRGDLADQVGLTEEEAQQVGEKAAEVLAELAKKAVAEAIKELPAAKQEKIKQMAGKPFAFVDPPRRGFGAPGADRGNRDETRGGAAPGGRRRGN